jgi:tetratricopeptide (TPR) repeat protein
MTAKPNLRFLFGLIAALAVMGVSVHYLHAYQNRRSAPDLLAIADREEAESNHGTALRALTRYLALVPSDGETRARHGLLFARLARTPEDQWQAYLTLEEILRQDPGRQDIRRRAVELAKRAGRYAEAEEHLQALLAASPADAALEMEIGQCREARESFEDAAAWYAKSLDHAPKNTDAAAALADLLRRRLNRADEADRVMDRLVAADESDFRAYLARGRYREEFVGNDAAVRDAERARALAPEDADVVLFVASLALKKGGKAGLERATDLLAQGVRAHPADARLVRSLALVQVRAGRDSEAKACLQAGLQTVPAADCVDVRWDLTALLIDRGALDEADDQFERLRDVGLPQHLLDFLDGRIAAGRGQWQQAVTLLERARPALQERTDPAIRADLLLGRCYERLGNTSERYSAYLRAFQGDPANELACLGLGAALESLGRDDEALDVYRRVAQKVPRARLREARLLLLRNRKLSTTDARWQDVSAALDDVARALPDEIQVPILRAEMLRAMGKGTEAIHVLEAARDRQPNRIELWLTLASVAEREGKPELATSVLDEAARQSPGSVDVLLARVACCTRQEPAAATAALAPLTAEASRLAEADRDRALRGIADAYGSVGAAKEAAAVWQRLVDRHPDDAETRLNLFEATLESAGYVAARAPLEELTRIDGADGDLARYARARLLLAQCATGDKQQLSEARSLLEAVAARRPAWGRVALCRARLAEAEDNADAAIDIYQEAVDAGERSPAVLRHLTDLLAEHRRYAETDRVLTLVPGRSPLARELRRRVAVAARQAGDPERAAELAEQAVPENSKEVREQMWLGEMLFSAGKYDRAELRLRRALDLSEAAADPYVAAVALEVRAGRKARAQELTLEAERKLPAAKKKLALAQCYETLGDTNRARELYVLALRERPNDAPALWAAIRFHLRNAEPALAEPLLRHLLGVASLPADQSARARRMLAVVLASQGDYRKTRQALTYLDLLEDHGAPAVAKGETADDLRVKVFVLAMQRTRPMRQRAIRLLEYLAEHDKPNPDDHFFLAQLYDAVGDWPKARERMLALLAQRESPVYLTYFARGLIQHENIAEANPWVMKLEALQPDAFATLELRCRILKEEQRTSQAVTLLKNYATRPGADLEKAATLLEELGELTAAEGLFRRLAAGAGPPENRLVLAAFLARQDRLPEALDLCEQARSTCPLESVAIVSVAALSAARWHEDLGRRVAVQYSAPWNEKQGRRVETWLEESLREQPKRNGVRSALAALRSLQEHFPEAETLYRDLLSDNPDDALALNNLAWLLAMGRGEGREALQLLDHAEEVVGPLPELMETRAVVHLSLGEDEPAVALLEEVRALNPTAVGYFHLSRAYRMAGNQPAAAQALAKARELGLRPERLHPRERVVLAQMVAEQTVR